MEYSMDEWVKMASSDRIIFRQAIHIVLSAIANSEYLQPKMIMKGGMLLGIRYKSSRFTEDIDFSAKININDINETEFIEELNNSLMIISDEYSYNILCKVQTFNIKPKNRNKNARYPSFELTIGYAIKTNTGEMNRLDRGQCTKTIKIDYSFNELTHEIDDIQVGDEINILTYGIIDLIAEKIRSVIQQPYRNRSRRQDIYDLCYLLNLDEINLDEQELLSILMALKEKSEGRIPIEDIHINTLDRDDIKNLSRKEYQFLSEEIPEKLPPFEDLYRELNKFYKSLPWDMLT